MTNRKIHTLIAALVFVLAACGGNDAASDTGGEPSPEATRDGAGDDGTQSSPEPDPGGDDGAAPADPPAVSEMGSFTVNGTEFAVTFLNRCVPFSGGDSGVIDLQPIAQGQGAQLNLYGDGGDSDEVSVQGSTIQDLFDSIAFSTFGAEESMLDGDRWTGSATLEDAAGGGADPVTVVWDVMVPPEPQEC